MTSETEYFSQNITFTNALSRPSTTKGSILSANGAGVFELIAPTADGQTLSALSTESSGVIWSASIQGFSFGFPMPNAIFPAETNSEYFLVTSSTNPRGLALLTSRAIFFSIRPDNTTGWATTNTNITGGTIDFTLGYVPANTQQIVSNFVAYSGGPHFQISGTSINTVGTKSLTFTTPLDITVTNDQQVSILLTNNLTSSADPGYTAQVNPFIIFRS